MFRHCGSSRADAAGGLRAAARAGRRAPAPGARARRAAGPQPHDLARATPPVDRERDHLRGARRAAPLRRSPRGRAALGARASSRRCPRGASSSATGRRSCSPRRRRRCSSPATSSSRRGRRTASTRSWRAAPAARAVPVAGFDVDAVLARGQRAHAADRAVQPKRPDGRSRRRRSAPRPARGAARARRRPARRGAARLRRRRGPRRGPRTARRPPAAARLPDVLEGVGPRGAARGLRARRSGRRAAARAPRARARARRARAGRRARGAADRGRPVVARRVAPWSPSARASPRALRAVGLEVAPSQANVLWLARAGRSRAPSSSRRLAQAGVVVAPRRPARRPRPRARRRPRPAGGDRLLAALERALPAL